MALLTNTFSIAIPAISSLKMHLNSLAGHSTVNRLRDPWILRQLRGLLIYVLMAVASESSEINAQVISCNPVFILSSLTDIFPFRNSTLIQAQFRNQ